MINMIDLVDAGDEELIVDCMARTPSALLAAPLLSPIGTILWRRPGLSPAMLLRSA